MFQIKAPLKLLYTKPNTASHDSVIRNTSDIIDNYVNSHGWHNIVVYIYRTANVPMFVSLNNARFLYKNVIPELIPSFK